MRKTVNTEAKKGLAYKARKAICLIVMSFMAFTTVSIVGDAEVYAATKAPATPSITSATVDGKTVTVKWKGVSRATSYQVAVRSQDKSWKYLKKVKKTSKNKRKYTKKNLYKVKKSGRYYKVYKYQYTYTILKTTSKSSRSATCSLSKGDHTYTLCVRAKAKKTAGSWGAKSVKTHSHKHAWEPVYRTEETVEVKPVTVTETVEEVVGREAYCVNCDEVLASFDDPNAEQELDFAVIEQHSNESDHICAIEWRDRTETKEVTRETGETEEVFVTKQVLDHYECDCSHAGSPTCCYADKSLDGKMTLHSHAWGDAYVSAEPTCEENGTRTTKCLDCGFEKNAAIAATGHSLATREGTKTIYKEEEVWHSANVCGCGYRTEDSAAWSAHCKTCRGWNSWVDEWCTIEKVPHEIPCTETYCTVCGKVLCRK